MTKEEYKALYKYLLKDCNQLEAFFERDKNDCYTGKFKISSEDKLPFFNKIFKTNISHSQYDVVSNGEGNEKEKIDSVYSSSLQSLLVFHNVSKTNKLKIGEYSFDKVLFEYRNTAIKSNRPSSVDVVLIDSDNKAIAFIESKFLEILRDSTENKKEVIGISYYSSKDPHGYNRSLNLDEEDFNKMKISYPDQGPYLDSVRGKSQLTQSIDKLDERNYVYADGIKQILSHMIGIRSFKNNESEYVDDPIINHLAFDKFIYIELFNSFPGLDESIKGTKIDDFINHCSVVKEVIMKKNKNLIDDFMILSYQDLFANNRDFNLSDVVARYFHIKG